MTLCNTRHSTQAATIRRILFRDKWNYLSSMPIQPSLLILAPLLQDPYLVLPFSNEINVLVPWMFF